MARPPWCLAFDLILPLLKLHRQPPRFWPAARRLHLLLHLDLQLPTASLLDRRRCAHSLRCSINWAAIASADPWPQHHLTPKTPKTPAAWHPGPRTGLWILLLPYLLLACLPTTRRKSFFSFLLKQRFVPNEKTWRHQSARISWSRTFLHCASHPPVTSWIAAAALIAPRQLVTSSPLRYWLPLGDSNPGLASVSLLLRQKVTSILLSCSLGIGVRPTRAFVAPGTFRQPPSARSCSHFRATKAQPCLHRIGARCLSQKASGAGEFQQITQMNSRKVTRGAHWTSSVRAKPIAPQSTQLTPRLPPTRHSVPALRPQQLTIKAWLPDQLHIVGSLKSKHLKDMTGKIDDQTESPTNSKACPQLRHLSQIL